MVAAEKDGVTYTTRTLTDHFATNRPNNILRANVLKFGMVDYYLIFPVRKINAWRLLDKQAKIIETRALKFYDKQLFVDELSTIYWARLLSQLMAKCYH